MGCVGRREGAAYNVADDLAIYLLTFEFFPLSLEAPRFLPITDT